jgi:hypothetical protein
VQILISVTPFDPTHPTDLTHPYPADPTNPYPTDSTYSSESTHPTNPSLQLADFSFGLDYPYDAIY